MASISDFFYLKLLSLFLLSFVAAGNSSPKVLCDFVAATNIESLFSEWSCSSLSEPVTNPCDPNATWTGLSCADNVTVVDISFNNEDINGTLPASLGQLTTLTDLTITVSSLSGTLPAALGSLSQLVSLILGENKISGSIPPQLAALTKLHQLYLYECPITGQLPDLPNMARLASLGIYTTRLTGSIPPSYGSLAFAQFLMLSGNSLTGEIPSALGQLGKLRALLLEYNSLTGTGPSAFACLTSMTEMVLSSNNLFGTIPDSLLSPPGIVELMVDRNFFSGEIPSAVGRCSALTFLSVSYNKLSGSLPAELSQAPLVAFIGQDNMLSGTVPLTLFGAGAATSVELSQNMFTGPVPPDLGSLTKLVVFTLSHNPVDAGPLPPALANATRLHILGLEDLFLTGPLAPLVCSLHHLQQLFLGNNNLTGTVPECLTSFPALFEMSLYSNQLTGPVPELSSLQLLVGIRLDYNSLSGTLSPQLCNLTHLQVFMFTDNQLFGSVPSCLAQLPLKYLFVGGNSLTGSIPPAFGQLSILFTLYMNDNFLTGPLPTAVTELPVLYYLGLQNNALTGQLVIGPQPVLVYMDLGGNAFTGGFPSLTESPGLGSIILSGNVGLTGSIPTLLGSITSLADLDVSNTALKGTIPSEICGTLGMSIDVSGSDIACYGGCLTSAAVEVTGASPSCHDGSILRRFLFVSGCAVLMVLLCTSASLFGGRWLRAFEAMVASWTKVSVEKAGTKTIPEPTAKLMFSSTIAFWQRLRLRVVKDGGILAMATVKLAFGVLISLTLNNWWTYGASSSSTRNAEVLESCSNPVVGHCASFCGHVLIIDVDIPVDDFVLVDDFVAPQLVISTHYAESDYCVAEFNGSCAHTYWLIFKLVPVLLHLLGFLLQLLAWYHVDEFMPQRRQFDTMIRHLYPDAWVLVTDFDAEGKCSESRLSERLSEASANSSVNPTAPSMPQGTGFFADRLAMVQELQHPRFYTVFAFVELVTLVYVWGELAYPPVYCGAVRPLSLYYYPILMSLLDLMKLNVYLGMKLVKAGRAVEGVCALLDARCVVTHAWTTVVLGVLFLFGALLDAFSLLCCGRKRAYRDTVSWPGTNEAGTVAMVDIQNPIQSQHSITADIEDGGVSTTDA